MMNKTFEILRSRLCVRGACLLRFFSLPAMAADKPAGAAQGSGAEV
jgi:hypothetical protein